MSSICVSLINVESTWSFKTEGDLKKNGWINDCVIIVGQRILSTLTYLLFSYFQWKKKKSPLKYPPSTTSPTTPRSCYDLTCGELYRVAPVRRRVGLCRTLRKTAPSGEWGGRGGVGGARDGAQGGERERWGETLSGEETLSDQSVASWSYVPLIRRHGLQCAITANTHLVPFLLLRLLLLLVAAVLPHSRLRRRLPPQ